MVSRVSLLPPHNEAMRWRFTNAFIGMPVVATQVFIEEDKTVSVLQYEFIDKTSRGYEQAEKITSWFNNEVEQREVAEFDTTENYNVGYECLYGKNEIVYSWAEYFNR